MKKLLFSVALGLCSFVFSASFQERRVDPTALAQLTSALGIPSDADLIAETQQRWLRKAGQERWEMEELPSDQRMFVLNWAENQGLFSDWKPSRTTYDTVLILGGTTGRMELRLNYLKQLWNEGVRFEKIVWLVGDRPLDTRVDGLTDQCKTETEAARVLWREADLPKEMGDLPVVFIAVPMKGEGSTLQRPNTEDTLIAWLDVTPAPCTALFVSNQPFCGYQFAVVEATLPDSFLFDLVGPGIDPSKSPSAAAITLDSLARWIWISEKKSRTP